MIRERALKVVLVLVGLLFSAGIYPLTSLRAMLHRIVTLPVPAGLPKR